jgi:hypothetical protein
MKHNLSFVPTRTHLVRLMKIYRSAGWPSRDALEIDLLGANLIRVSIAKTGHETLCLTDAGVEVLVDARRHGARSSTSHDRLAQRMAEHLMASGRVVWRELSFRAQSTNGAESEAGPTPVDAALPFAQHMRLATRASTHKSSWRLARPDVFSVRNTSVEDYLHPMVHEIKSSRADLLCDLRNTAKRSSYQWLCCECFYVFPSGVAEVQEIPKEFGVWVLHGGIEDGRLELVRPAPHSPCKLPFTAWLTLAKAAPMQSDVDVRQGCLPVQDGFPEQDDSSAISLVQ